MILSAGAIGSPAILLRSGIGPAGHLAELGIAPVVDLPGVGARLWDHPGVSMLLAPQPGLGGLNAPCMQIAARYLDEGSSDRGEVFLFLASGMDVTGVPEVSATVGGPVAMEFCPVLMRPRAAGRLTLRSADPHQQPAIELGFGADPVDLRRMKDGVRLMHDLARSAEMAAVVRDVAGLDESVPGLRRGSHDVCSRERRYVRPCAGNGPDGQPG